MNLAIYQPDAKQATPTHRLQSLDAVLEEHRHQQTQLLLCPELFLSGYAEPDLVRQYACSVDDAMGDETIKQLSGMASRHGVAIACGYAEKEGSALYNSMLCISASGSLLANHRKRVLPTRHESDLFNTGHQMTLFELDNGMCAALLICYEVEFPEAVRACALAGAQLVLVATALGREWSVVSRQLVPSRAFENGVFLAYANYCAADKMNQYLGDSVIVSPVGEDLNRAGNGVEFISAKLDLALIEKARARLPYLRDYSRIV